jgi:hypothetical protein
VYTLTDVVDLPDSFFELTSSELQYILHVQKQKRVQEEAKGLVTSAMRITQEQLQAKKHPKTLLRIRFPDRWQVEATFLSQQSLADVYAFVRSCLRQPGPFRLFVAPPHKDLSDTNDVTIYAVGLSPASVVHFIYSDDRNVKRISVYVCPSCVAGEYLSAEWTDKAEPLQVLVPETVSLPQLDTPTTSTSVPETQHQPPQQPEQKSKPKWLKLAKK